MNRGEKPSVSMVLQEKNVMSKSDTSRPQRRLSRALWRVTLWPRFAYHYTRALVGLALVGAALGCSTQTRTPHEEASRQLCLAQAEVDMDARADELCPKTWDTCEHRPAIMAELQRRQEACR